MDQGHTTARREGALNIKYKPRISFSNLTDSLRKIGMMDNVLAGGSTIIGVRTHVISANTCPSLDQCAFGGKPDSGVSGAGIQSKVPD